MRPLRLAVLTVTSALAVGVAAPAFAAEPPGPAGIGLAPAHRQPGGVGYLVESLRPGGTATEQVIVANPGANAVRLLVNPVDGLTASATGAVYADRQDPVRRAGAWLTLPSPTLNVPPGRRLTVNVTIRVPTDAMPGDHLAGVAFENAVTTSRRAGALTVRTVNRSVIGVLIHVSGATATRMHVSDAGIAELPGFGSASLRIAMANTGQRLVKPRMQISLSGPSGYRRVVTRQLDTVLPGDAIELQQPWPNHLRAGVYPTVITLTAPGMAPVTYTANLRLGHALAGTVAGLRPAHPARTSRLPLVRVVPLAALAALALLALVAGVAAWNSRGTGRRRQRTSPSGRHRAPGGVASANAHAGVDVYRDEAPATPHALTSRTTR